MTALNLEKVTKKLEYATAQVNAMQALIPNFVPLMNKLALAASNLNTDEPNLWAIDGAAADAIKAMNAVLDPPMDAWLKAQNTWIRYAAQEKANGHNGQLAISRGCFNSDQPFFIRFAEMQARISKMRKCTPGEFEVLIYELGNLVVDISSFIQEDWCRDCGDPVSHGWTQCRKHKGAPVVAEKAATTPAPAPRKRVKRVKAAMA